MAARGKKTHETIAGHTLTYAERYVLNTIQDYMRAHSGDSGWTANTSPIGDGRSIPLRTIFPGVNNGSAQKCHSARRLARLGVLKACGMEMVADAIKGVPQ